MLTSPTSDIKLNLPESGSKGNIICRAKIFQIIFVLEQINNHPFRIELVIL